jgi:hypothetical protein
MPWAAPRGTVFVKGKRGFFSHAFHRLLAALIRIRALLFPREGV